MTRWLSEDEQVSWRNWLSANLLLPERLGRDLHEEAGLTLADYEILVRLSESPDRRVRMSDLASQTLSSRSRLSHQIDRMEKARYVQRQECRDDRRGYFAVLTDHGWQTLVEAAPAHVESVRRRLVDVLTPEEFAELGRLCHKIVEGKPSDQ
jgi:DNA-binding MarR family transcriptional regulator